MMPTHSLQRRLAIGLAAGLACFWVAATISTTLTVRSEIGEMFDAALEETAQRILPLAVVDIVGREEEGLSQTLAVVRPHDELLTFLVRDNQGRVLIRSHDAKDADFPPFEHIGFSETASHRLYFETALQGSITIAVAEPLHHRQEALRETIIAMIVPLAYLVPFSLIGVWLLVRLSFRPVRALQNAIEARGGADLTPVTVPSLPREISPLVQSINDLMARLQLALEAERTFATNSAHELRTPVAAALAQTQRMIAESNDAVVRTRATEIETALQRLSRLSEKLLQLARSDSTALIASEPGDLVPILRLVVQDFARHGEGQDRIISNLPQEAVMAKIDPNGFAILVRNLIENALKHGDEDQPVNVTLTTDKVLTVANAGPVVPSEMRAGLTKAFARGDTKASGTGMGLAIVNSIASGSGATLTLFSPARGRSDGFEVEVRLQ